MSSIMGTRLRSHMYLLSALALLLNTSPVHAIDERLLILPPSIHSDPQAGNPGRLWNRTIELYWNSVLNTTPIPPDQLLRAWTGDTLRIDYYDIESAREWGEKLEADAILLSEWQVDKEGEALVSLQRLDLWTGELRGPVQKPSIALAVAALEPDRFVFETPFTPVDVMLADAGGEASAYTAPSFERGSLAVHEYAHRSRSYPPDALIQGMTGTADVRVTVSREGVPIAVQLTVLSPRDQGFEAAFEKALWAVTYTPAKWMGQEVNAVLKARVRMDPVP